MKRISLAFVAIGFVLMCAALPLPVTGAAAVAFGVIVVIPTHRMNMAKVKRAKRITK